MSCLTAREGPWDALTRQARCKSQHVGPQINYWRLSLDWTAEQCTGQGQNHAVRLQQWPWRHRRENGGLPLTAESFASSSQLVLSGEFCDFFLSIYVFFSRTMVQSLCWDIPEPTAQINSCSDHHIWRENTDENDFETYQKHCIRQRREDGNMLTEKWALRHCSIHGVVSSPSFMAFSSFPFFCDSRQKI